MPNIGTYGGKNGGLYGTNNGLLYSGASMSVSSSKDPRQTIKDILDDTIANDWTGTKPTNIEKYESTEMSVKTERQNDSIYILKPGDGEKTQFGAKYDRVEVTHIIEVQVWTLDSDSRAEDLRQDIQNHILNNYNSDNLEKTSWNEIAPVSDTDFRQQKAPQRADHYVESIQIRLRALRP